MPDHTETVALFATCLVELVRPRVGIAAVSLLEEAGMRVAIPQAQTCCGQVNMNSGDRVGAAHLARQTIAVLEPYEAVVVPSGSCAATIKRHYPTLLADDPDWQERARALARKTDELTSFLARCGLPARPQSSGIITYHDSCAGLRELGIKTAPRDLLACRGIEVTEMRRPERCCGFGGLFCTKYPEISADMTDEKAKDIRGSGAEAVAMGDVGCLMTVAGRLKRAGDDTPVYHVAEVLAGMTEPE